MLRGPVGRRVPRRTARRPFRRRPGPHRMGRRCGHRCAARRRAIREDLRTGRPRAIWERGGRSFFMWRGGTCSAGCSDRPTAARPPRIGHCAARAACRRPATVAAFAAVAAAAILLLRSGC
eukprot:7381592-Prymnesium_polylepis.1